MRFFRFLLLAAQRGEREETRSANHVATLPPSQRKKRAHGDGWQRCTSAVLPPFDFVTVWQFKRKCKVWPVFWTPPWSCTPAASWKCSGRLATAARQNQSGREAQTRRRSAIPSHRTLSGGVHGGAAENNPPGWPGSRLRSSGGQGHRRRRQTAVPLGQVGSRRPGGGGAARGAGAGGASGRLPYSQGCPSGRWGWAEVHSGHGEYEGGRHFEDLASDSKDSW